jgi:ureidoacrylate peracid hydrolase
MSKSPADVEDASRIAHVRPLTSLKEKVAPGRAALIVIDMQNDFCASNGMMAEEGLNVSEAEKLGARLPAVLQAARKAGVLVIFVRNVYSSPGNAYLSDAWLEQASRRRVGSYVRRPICAEGSWGGDFFGDVRPLPGEAIVTKHRFSAFYNTDLDTILRANGIRTIVMTGVATNVCVETTAREGFVRDYYVVMVEDGTAAYAQDYHDAAIKVIDHYFGEVTRISELLSIWKTYQIQPEKARAAAAG